MRHSRNRQRQLLSASWLKEMGSLPFRTEAWRKVNLLKTGWDHMLYFHWSKVHLLLWILVFFVAQVVTDTQSYIFFLWLWWDYYLILWRNAEAPLFLLLLLPGLPKIQTRVFFDLTSLLLQYRQIILLLTAGIHLLCTWIMVVFIGPSYDQGSVALSFSKHDPWHHFFWKIQGRQRKGVWYTSRARATKCERATKLFKGGFEWGYAEGREVRRRHWRQQKL